VEREARRFLRRGSIPLFLHGLVEYLAGIVFIAAPFAFSFDSHAAPTILSILIGAGVLVLAVVTEYPAGLVRSFPLASHVVIDYVLSIFLIVSPFVFGFSDERGPLAFFLVIGVAYLLMTVMTRFRKRDRD
jgi:K+-sensing histidine kinase KdpD